jgi:hypothetical protein
MNEIRFSAGYLRDLISRVRRDRQFVLVGEHLVLVPKRGQPGAPKNEKLRSKIQELVRAGMGKAEIAKTLGSSTQNISQLIYRMKKAEKQAHEGDE